MCYNTAYSLFIVFGIEKKRGGTMEIVYSRDIGLLFDLCGIVFCLSNEKEAREELFVIPNRKQKDLDYLDFG